MPEIAKKLSHFLALFFSFLFIALPLGCSSAKDEALQVIMQTSKGDVTLELYPDKAPITVANFMQYVENNAYESATFYRATRSGNDPSITVLQGGLWRPWEEGMIKNYKSPFPSIPHETTEVSGLSHKDGTISMGRLDPGTANSEFFISLGDNLSLDYGGDRNPDGQGYAVFGRVIAGMDVMRTIHALPTEKGEGFKQQILVQPVDIDSIEHAK